MELLFENISWFEAGFLCTFVTAFDKKVLFFEE
jgi:hypothetical protein